MQYYFLLNVVLPIILCFTIPFPVVLCVNWISWKNSFNHRYGYSKIYPLGRGILIALGISLMIGLEVGIIAWASSQSASAYIAFSGQIVNPSAREWPNDRLVLLYLKGNEMARSTTSATKVAGNDLGVTDGAFYIETLNPYQISQYLLYSDNSQYVFEKTSRWDWSSWPWSKSILYLWLGQVEEGNTIRIPIPSKNIEYVIKVLQGDINSLPPEMLQPGSTRLRDDGQIIVALPDSISPDGTQTSGIFVQDISYATKTEQVETNKLTVPINNCAGSVEVGQKYTQTQTFVHQYTGEVGFNIGVEIPLIAWAKLTPEFTTKYGFENGQIDTRTVEYNMAAAPETNVVYIVTWSEVWESGAANVINGNDTIVIPFRVKTNLIYDIASEPRTCP